MHTVHTVSGAWLWVRTLGGSTIPGVDSSPGLAWLRWARQHQAGPSAHSRPRITPSTLLLHWTASVPSPRQHKNQHTVRLCIQQLTVNPLLDSISSCMLVLAHSIGRVPLSTLPSSATTVRFGNGIRELGRGPPMLLKEISRRCKVPVPLVANDRRVPLSLFPARPSVCSGLHTKAGNVPDSLLPPSRTVWAFDQLLMLGRRPVKLASEKSTTSMRESPASCKGMLPAQVQVACYGCSP